MIYDKDNIPKEVLKKRDVTRKFKFSSLNLESKYGGLSPTGGFGFVYYLPSDPQQLNPYSPEMIAKFLSYCDARDEIENTPYYKLTAKIKNGQLWYKVEYGMWLDYDLGTNSYSTSYRKENSFTVVGNLIEFIEKHDEQRKQSKKFDGGVSFNVLSELVNYIEDGS